MKTDGNTIHHQSRHIRNSCYGYCDRTGDCHEIVTLPDHVRVARQPTLTGQYHPRPAHRSTVKVGSCTQFSRRRCHWMSKQNTAQSLDCDLETFREHLQNASDLVIRLYERLDEARLTP